MNYDDPVALFKEHIHTPWNLEFNRKLEQFIKDNK